MCGSLTPNRLLLLPIIIIIATFLVVLILVNIENHV